jgi:hypothetical protein
VLLKCKDARFCLFKLYCDFRVGVLMFIHNLILFYSNHDGDEPPNESSSHTATTNAAGAGQTKGGPNAK